MAPKILETITEGNQRVVIMKGDMKDVARTVDRDDFDNWQTYQVESLDEKGAGYGTGRGWRLWQRRKEGL